MRRANIVWTELEYAAVAARTVQLRDSEAYTNQMEACVAAQKELLPVDRIRMPPKNGNLGGKFTDLVAEMRSKHRAQVELAVSAYKAERAAADQSQMRLETFENTPAPAPVAAPVIQAAPAAVAPVPAMGVLLESIMRQTFDQALEKMIGQLKAEIGPTLARLRPEFEKRIESTVADAIAETIAEALPQADPAILAPAEPTARPRKIRVIVFGLLDAQIATVKESLKQHIEMNRVDVLCTKDKNALYKMDTDTSHVIHVQKFSNHLPPDYFKRVKTLTVANGLSGVKDRILEIIKLERNNA